MITSNTTSGTTSGTTGDTCCWDSSGYVGSSTITVASTPTGINLVWNNYGGSICKPKPKDIGDYSIEELLRAVREKIKENKKC